MQSEISAAFATTERLTEGGPDAIMSFDVDGHRKRINGSLSRVSDLARAGGRARVNASAPRRPGSGPFPPPI
ncbi:hypothetical protein [Arthrobacter sp. A5]|uniref:hypothetical protein n=1 Tax=Arthrobacter sp. A5 TaxID=576926 RepID=UPI003DA8FB9A